MQIKPKNIKFSKIHRNKIYIKKNSKQITKSSKIFNFGKLALVCLEFGYLKNNHLEAGKKTIKYHANKNCHLWLIPFPHKSFTKKTVGSRMGKGKGSVSIWVAKIKPGKVIYEISLIQKDLGIFALQKAAKKLPLKTKIIYILWH